MKNICKYAAVSIALAVLSSQPNSQISLADGLPKSNLDNGVILLAMEDSPEYNSPNPGSVIQTILVLPRFFSITSRLMIWPLPLIITVSTKL